MSRQKRAGKKPQGIGSRMFDIINDTLLALIAIIMFYPMFYVFIVSISSSEYINQGLVTILPKGIKLEAYKVVFQNKAIWSGYKKANGFKTPETFDELLNLLIELKEIYPDSVPWTMRKGTANLLKTTAYMLGSGHGSNGLYYDFDVDGGKYVFGPASLEFKEVLRYLNKAYEAGVLDPDFATSTAEQMESKLSGGRGK